MCSHQWYVSFDMANLLQQGFTDWQIFFTCSSMFMELYRKTTWMVINGEVIITHCCSVVVEFEPVNDHPGSLFAMQAFILHRADSLSTSLSIDFSVVCNQVVKDTMISADHYCLHYVGLLSEKERSQHRSLWYTKLQSFTTRYFPIHVKRD